MALAGVLIVAITAGFAANGYRMAFRDKELVHFLPSSKLLAVIDGRDRHEMPVVYEALEARNRVGDLDDAQKREFALYCLGQMQQSQDKPEFEGYVSIFTKSYDSDVLLTSDWTRYLSVLLERAAEAARPDLDEEARRVGVYALRLLTVHVYYDKGKNDELLREIAEIALSVQADPEAIWHHRWGDLILLAYKRGVVDSLSWGASVRRNIMDHVVLHTRGAARVGEPIAVSVSYDPGRSRSHRKDDVWSDWTPDFRVSVTPMRARLGGQETVLPDETMHVLTDHFDAAGTQVPVVFSDEQWRSIATGGSRLEVDLRLIVHYQNHRSEAFYESTIVDDRTLSRSVMVMAEDSPYLVQPVVDQEREQLVTAGLRAEIRRSRSRSGYPFEVIIQSDGGHPVAIAGYVFVILPDGEEVQVGPWLLPPGNSRWYREDIPAMGIPTDGRPIRVEVRPAHRIAVQSIDMREYWAEPIDFNVRYYEDP